MSFDHLFIRDVEGERRVAADELPLRVGTGTDSTLRLPGPGGAPVALLDLLDGVPFVQPVGRDTSFLINGEPLETSRRLEDGDELQFFGSRIRATVDDQRVLLDVKLEDSAYVTKPPQETDDEALPDSEAIAPTAFRRAAETTAQLETSRKSPLKMIVGSGLAVLLFASYLLFSAKSVEFEIDPPGPDGFNIDGGWFRLPIGERTLLRKGTYTVKVRKQGYYDIDQSFVVGDEKSMTVSLRMRKKPGKLLVVAEPPVDAIVTVNDDQVGKAPFGPLELQPGTHSVRVESLRFLPFSDVVEMAGLERVDSMYVQLVPRWANVSVQSEPPGADIFAGEEKVGVTPAVIELLEGKHEITVAKDGYAPWDGNVVAEPNVAQSIPNITLQPANAKLLVNTIPRGANVTVNGRYRGQSPITLSLSPDIDYEVGISKAGYGVTTRSLRLESAASESITVDLSARLGTVTVTVQPEDATVYVDGRSRGRGKTTLRLSSAPHRIEVRRQGYRSWTRTVTPRPGYPQTLSARLRSLEAVARDAVAQTVQTASSQTLRRVEGGTFSMGASRAEAGRRANEVIRPVTITRPFLIGIHEVTNKEFAQFRKNHDSGADVHLSLAADDNPVANVSWSDAVEYCNWLSKQEGRTPAYREEFGEWVPIYPTPDGYRLPTEAEWVLAIRYAGGKRAFKFPWGDKWPPPEGSGNLADLSARELVPSILPGYDDGYASSAPVGKFKPNPIGIYDTAGNVAEWVNDFYTVPTPGITQPVVDPVGPERGTSHVVRGSSWRHSGITELRLSYRDYSTTPRPDIGFRIARYAQ
ncbi:MAG: SUMF1/EgtB/PvdO family nonheme iron enzyme [Gammaproteobacteria bacterium]|nr:SUMF1/EgtB/PvdO family nonheme iron enzyme [Gammaproteobacteria bacterium]MBU2675948.1 SUMF1/EgtB/PvdO family nonheme iron enzyme [Gammaproteobacteria bacterium]NNL49684.1 SUMF1/EgtB/PvdO family nonheme iron enzyme [Woeseiaceae bacterium]